MIRSLLQARKFQQLLDGKWNMLYRIAYSWCHDPDLASDLAQDSLIKAYRKRSQLRDQDSIDSWLCRILANTWRDHCRAKRDTVNIEDVVLVDPHTPRSVCDRDETIQSVRRAIASLPHDQKQVVSLVDIQGMSYQEVAVALEIPVGTVMSRLCRARKTLRELLFKSEPSERQIRPNIRRIK